jgi:predicted HTH domain antitoxin
MVKTIVLNIPETVDLDDQEATFILAAKLYEKSKITIGQGAQMVGLSKMAFMEMLGKYGVSIINYPADEIEQDINNAQRYHS